MLLATSVGHLCDSGRAGFESGKAYSYSALLTLCEPCGPASYAGFHELVFAFCCVLCDALPQCLCCILVLNDVRLNDVFQVL